MCGFESHPLRQPCGERRCVHCKPLSDGGKDRWRLGKTSKHGSVRWQAITCNERRTRIATFFKMTANHFLCGSTPQAPTKPSFFLSLLSFLSDKADRRLTARTDGQYGERPVAAHHSVIDGGHSQQFYQIKEWKSFACGSTPQLPKKPL